MNEIVTCCRSEGLEDKMSVFIARCQARRRNEVQLLSLPIQFTSGRVEIVQIFIQFFRNILVSYFLKFTASLHNLKKGLRLFAQS